MLRYCGTGHSEFSILKIFLNKVWQSLVALFWPIQRGQDDVFDVGKAVDADEFVADALGTAEVAEVPAHMFAQLDKVVFAFEFSMDAGMFEGHQQALFA